MPAGDFPQNWTEIRPPFTAPAPAPAPAGTRDPRGLYLFVSTEPKPFKWLDHWYEDKELMDMLEASYGSFKGRGIMPVLRQCKTVTKEWERCNRTNDPESIQAIENKCQAIENERTPVQTLVSY
ncbi:hypothetical protein V6N11_035849 [Hibiscus sabdariffa]|uniref:Uncharacterized protein n=1 Tax=Hibiscus sabdariffa TaxID=183260 RepID=A0ABR2R975_9ROSI